MEKPAIHPGPTKYLTTKTKINTTLIPPPSFFVPNNQTITNFPREDQGDLLVRGLWSKRQYCVIDVRITDINDKTQYHIKLEAVLRKNQKENKNKYIKACIAYFHDFTPLFSPPKDCLVTKPNPSLSALPNS